MFNDIFSESKALLTNILTRNLLVTRNYLWLLEFQNI